MAGRNTKGRKASIEALARGNRLREARLAAGLSVDDVAARLGVKPMAIYRWEWGAASFHVDDAARVAEAYRIRAGYLVAGELPARAKRARRKAA